MNTLSTDQYNILYEMVRYFANTYLDSDLVDSQEIIKVIKQETGIYSSAIDRVLIPIIDDVVADHFTPFEPEEYEHQDN